MSTDLTFPLVAVVAGLVSFSSPCCLPLMPGYLSYISTLPMSDLGAEDARRAALRASLMFVGGFTTVFTLLGVGAAAMGGVILRNQDAIVAWFGVVIVLLGLSTIGVLRIPGISRERRLDLSRIPPGPRWAFPMGMAFAAGWVPCVGPVLATILATAAVGGGGAAWGGALLALYSLGLGIPFVLLAVGFNRARRSLKFLRDHGRQLELAGGFLMVAVGVLFISGRWSQFFRPLQRWFAEFGWPPI